MVPLLLARSAGPELLGEFATLINLVALFAFLSTFGLPVWLTREVACQREDKEQVGRLVNISLGLVIVLSVVTAVLMVGLGIGLNYSTVLLRALTLAALALTFDTLARVLTASFYGIEEMEWALVIAFVTEVLFLGLVVAAIPFKVSIDWLMFLYLISRIVSFVAAAQIYQPRFGGVRPAVDKKLWWSLLKTSFPYAINQVVSATNGSIGLVVLSTLSGTVTVALFDIGLGLTMRLNVLARAVNQALYPFLSAQFVKDEHSVRAYTAKSIHLLIIPGCLIATILWVFGHDIVLFLYGEKFLGAVSGLMLLALIIPLRFAGNSLATMLTATGRQEKRSTAVVIVAVTNVLLSLLLIPPFRLMGAVYSTLITEVLLTGVYIWYLKTEIRDMIQWRMLIAPGLGSLLILWGSLLFINTFNTWLLIALSVLLYTLAVVGLDRSSIKSLRLIATRKQS